VPASAALASWNLHKMARPNNASGAKSKREMVEHLWTNF
jgi:hypothetical protein